MEQKQKYWLYGILITIVIVGLIFIKAYKISESKNIISITKNTIEPIESTYIFEPNWWLKSQTFGMFNYYGSTNYERLKATNCTVNGYRLVYDLSKFDYKKDVENAHEKGIKYVIGMLFRVKKDKIDDNTSLDSICLPYTTIKTNTLQKAKKIIDFGVDGLAIIQPFGDDLFIESSISCLCPENSRANLTREHQLNCAVKFYQQFVKKIKKYAESKGKENFPIVPASHGEWLIPLTIDMLPDSDFAFANLNFEDYTHPFLYKLHLAATKGKGTLIASPVDASFGWLVENSEKPEDLIQIKMAEAYANKGAFQDQYQAGLSPSCIDQSSFAEKCWLDKSINADAVGKINSFYLSNKDFFDLGSSSMAKIAILFSAKSVTNVESEHWSLFTKVSRILTSAHLQYDVIFSEDSDLSINTLTLEKLKQYEIIVLAENKHLDNNAISLLTKYLEEGGKIIIINQIDSRLILSDKTPHTMINLEPDLFQSALFLETIGNMLNKRVSEDSLPRDVGIQIWQNHNKTVLHLINYNFNLDKGVISKQNILVSINTVKKPKRIRVFSPDFEGEQNLEFNFSDNNLQFAVPELKIWDVLIIE